MLNMIVSTIVVLLGLHTTHAYLSHVGIISNSHKLSDYHSVFNPLISTNAVVTLNLPSFRLSIQSTDKYEVDSSDGSDSKSILPGWLGAFTTACLGGALFGLDIGSSSSVLRILGSAGFDAAQTAGDAAQALDPIQLGQIAGGSLLGAIISSTLIILIGDKDIGRKVELQISSLLFLLGTVVQSVLSSSIHVLLGGRILYGLGIGVAMHAAPLFIAETAPNKLRGRLVSFKEAAIVIGIVAGYAAGAYFGGSSDWRAVWLDSAIPLEVLMIIGSFFLIPESPRWLALRNRKAEAVESLKVLQPELSVDEASSQVQEMITLSSSSSSSVAMDQSTTGVIEGETKTNDALESLKEIFGSPYNRRALVIGIGLVAFQQFSGQPSVLYFANRLFEQAGLGYEAALLIGVFKLIMTFVSAYLVENPQFGRRTLLLIGNSGVTLSLLSLAYFYLGGNAVTDGVGSVGPSVQQYSIIASMLIFVGSYQIGFGPISWLILSEIFPLRIRSTALSLGTLVNFSSNLLVTLIFEAERVLVGESLLFLQFGLIGLAATVFTYFLVFETRGLSLEEIEVKLKKEVDGGSA
jgi:sugar porter (SP) family MFS transporter